MSMTEKELLISIHERLGEIQGQLSIARAIVPAVLSGGVAWLSFLTLHIFGVFP